MLFPSTAVDSEDGVAIEAPGNLPLDTDFLLEQDIHFHDPDHDGKILNLEKFRGLFNTFFFFHPKMFQFSNSLDFLKQVWFSHAGLIGVL